MVPTGQFSIVIGLPGSSNFQAHVYDQMPATATDIFFCKGGGERKEKNTVLEITQNYFITSSNYRKPKWFL